MHLTVKKARRLLKKHAPIHLEHRRSFPEESMNGQVGPTMSSISVGRGADGLIRVAIRQCCVHMIVKNVGEELLHADGWLEKDINNDIRHETVRLSSVAQEVAYALLSAAWKIPMYCEAHASKR
jgi:hypothetical protein